MSVHDDGIPAKSLKSSLVHFHIVSKSCGFTLTQPAERERERWGEKIVFYDFVPEGGLCIVLPVDVDNGNQVV